MVRFFFFNWDIGNKLLREDFYGTMCARARVCVYGSGGVIKSLLFSVRLTSRNIGINYIVEIFILVQF